MSNNGTISIALAAYNGEKYLPELLRSLEAQTIKPYELVVVDDCSSDNSLNIINAFPLSFEKKVFLNERNMGVVYTFKKLAALCKGNFIAFCDQDDIWLPEKLEVSLAETKKINSNIPGITFTDLSVIDGEGNLIRESYWRQRSVHPDKFSFADILFANVITGCTTMINRSMAIELSRMPLNIIMHDHWMALIGYSFGKYIFIDKPTLLFRSHQNSVTDKKKFTTVEVFLSDFKNRSIYLKENIQQAIEFKTLYSSKLNDKNAKELDRFISLKQKSFFYKRLRRDTRSLLRRLK